MAVPQSGQVGDLIDGKLPDAIGMARAPSLPYRPLLVSQPTAPGARPLLVMCGTLGLLAIAKLVNLEHSVGNGRLPFRLVIGLLAPDQADSGVQIICYVRPELHACDRCGRASPQVAAGEE
jgi:hypothetical protein